MVLARRLASASARARVLVAVSVAGVEAPVVWADGVAEQGIRRRRPRSW